MGGYAAIGQGSALGVYLGVIVNKEPV